MVTEEEKQQAKSIGLEPEVVFNTISDRRIRDKLQNIADIESMLDGLKDLFRRVVMQDLLESNVEKTNS